MASGSLKTRAPFVFIEADANADGLAGTVMHDDHRFLRNRPCRNQSQRRCADGLPAFLETGAVSVFAAGGVRSGAAKRMGSAVCERATAMRKVDDYLMTRTALRIATTTVADAANGEIAIEFAVPSGLDRIVAEGEICPL
ncbi:hypothetical protein B8W69_28605 [Mycobacterium vulneris]|uniref:Uncharacterized protein n=1 Tax=Mycolicibacterium vulneris TaxID=547163 RepID=A0A1X2KIC1_9MYCO|nr:hypothetical protein B8W69_28605 [Mycolicibacterium vulneris]